jgi:hypothetical protein
MWNQSQTIWFKEIFLVLRYLAIDNRYHYLSTIERELFIPDPDPTYQVIPSSEQRPNPKSLTGG